MLRLLNIALHKFRYQKSSKILTAIYLGTLAILICIPFLDFYLNNGLRLNLGDTGALDFPYIWHLSTYFFSFPNFILFFVIVGMISAEYNHNTLKQNLIDGLSKKEFVLSKCYLVLLFSTIATVIVGISTLVVGLSYSSFTEWSIVITDCGYLIAFFVKAVSFLSLGLLLGTLTRRGILTIGITFIWYIGELIAIHNIFKIKNDYYEYLFPLQSIFKLIKEPFSRTDTVKGLANQMNVDLPNDYTVNYMTVVVAIIWTILFVFGTYKILKKRDL